VRANDGTQWSAWSPGFAVTAAIAGEVDRSSDTLATLLAHS
jgi:hypothetical protein